LVRNVKCDPHAQLTLNYKII